MLKVTKCQMRNLVSQFGGRRAGRAWVSIGNWCSLRLIAGPREDRLIIADANRHWDRKPVIEVRGLRVGLADQLDALRPEEVLAAVNSRESAPSRRVEKQR